MHHECPGKDLTRPVNGVVIIYWGGGGGGRVDSCERNNFQCFSSAEVIYIRSRVKFVFVLSDSWLKVFRCI